MINKCSSSQLSIELEFVFIELTDLYSFGQDRMKEIKKSVLAEAYVLSPLKIEVFQKSHPKPQLFTLSVPALPNVFFSLRPEKEEDDLVLTTLGRMLNLTFVFSSIFINQSFGLRKHFRDFYSELVSWGEMEMLFDFDLTLSLSTISRSHLFSKLKPFVNYKYIF